jgi:hypothetical protein
MTLKHPSLDSQAEACDWASKMCFMRSRRLEAERQVRLANLDHQRSECLAAAAETIRTLARLSGLSQEKDIP